MNEQWWGVRNKDTGLWFKGFDDSDEPVWTDDITEAWSCHHREGADAQAYLLERFQ